MINLIENFIKGKNAKYLIIICFGIMLLIASSSFSKDGGKNGSISATEKRLTNILNQIDGVFDVTVMISSSNNKADGVIIVARGAENPEIKSKICSAATAAIGVPPHKIEVFSKKRGE